MLWLRPRAALSGNGSHVSILPVPRSSRWTAAKPLLFVHTLPSTREWSGLVMLTWVMSLFTSGGRLQVENVAVLRSNFAMPPWNIIPSQRLLSRSKRTDRAPVGKPGFSSGTRYSVTRPVLGSSLPSVCSPKLQYQATPSGSTMTSWGWIVGRGRSYSVITTRVLRPVRRGSALSSYGHDGRPLWSTPPRNSASALPP